MCIVNIRSKGSHQSQIVQFSRFVLAAATSVPINIATRVALSRYVPFEISVLLSHAVGMLIAYTLSRIFVFERSGYSTGHELGRFAMVNVISATLTWLVSVGLLRYVFPTFDGHVKYELLAHVIGLGLASVISFLGHSHYSFRRADSISHKGQTFSDLKTCNR